MKKIFLLLLLSTTFVFSQAVFNLQGVLRLPTGKAATDGNYEFKFLIYEQQTGGTALNWAETQTVVVQNGLYNILVGNKTSFTGLAFDKNYYIGMSVGAEDEMLPRIRLTGAPYALSLQGTNNKVPNSGAMQFDTGWHKSADTQGPKNRIRFVNNAETIINSKVKDKDGFIQPTGAIIAFGGSVAPAGWLICDGSEIAISGLYAELYAVLGDNYKNSNDNPSGAVTAGKFRIPNLKGRTPIGTGITNTAFNQTTGGYNQPFSVGLGASAGTNNFRLEIAHMPSHKHSASISAMGSDPRFDWQSYTDMRSTMGWNARNQTTYTNPEGGSQAHDNMPPYLGINYIIKY